MMIHKQEILSLPTREVVGYALRRSRGGKTIYVAREVLDEVFRGNPEAAWKEISRLWDKNLLPHTGSVQRPISRRALELAYRNEALGKRHWRYFHVTRGKEYYYGYGYEESGKIVLVDKNDRPWVVINKK